MVRFDGLCDGKIMVRKTKIFWFLCGNVFFFHETFGARYLIVKYYWLNTCRLCNKGCLISFLIHGKSMVKVFG